jgi:hypothetical protein
MAVEKSPKSAWKVALAKYGVVLKDATKPLLLTVTEADRKGLARDPGACDFFRAAIRQGAVYAQFGNKIANVIFKDGNHYKASRYTLPKAVQDMIVVKDNGGAVALGDYLLEVPTPARRLDYKAPAKRGHKKRKYTRTATGMKSHTILRDRNTPTTGPQAAAA